MSQGTLSSASEFRLGHRPELDGLRAIAVLSIMLAHSGIPLLEGAYLGVDIFFVLSGFLITCLLLEEWQRSNGIHLKHFYLRRALRLWPALFLMLGVCALDAWLFVPDIVKKPFPGDALGVLFYYANWWLAQVCGLHYPKLLHTWSLAVEEQFYWVWPVVLLMLLRLRLRRRYIMLLVAAGIAAIPTWRCLLWRGEFSYRIYAGTDTRADALLAGCLIGMIASWNLLPRALYSKLLVRGVGLVGAALLGWHLKSCVISHAYISCAGFTVVAVLVASLLCGLLISQDGMLARVLRVGPLAWVGRISYGLYLWNTPVFMTLANCLGHLQPWSGFLIKVAVNFALATLSFYLVEKPFLRLKARFSATRQSTRRQPLFLAAQPQSRAA